MIEKKQLVERRKHKRFKAPRDAFVAIRPHYAEVGQITDVSMGGLGFHCLATEEPSDGSSELDIFLSGRAFWLHRVPFKTIWSVEIPGKTPLTAVPMRRSGVQFGELTPNQRSQLEYFIENHCTEA